MTLPSLRRIKASAGSGKTYTLTSNFLRLLAGSGSAPRCGSGSGCRPAFNIDTADDEATPGRKKVKHSAGHDWPEIMAVTFTNLAAAEMKERVLSRLKDIALGVVAPEQGWTKKQAARAVESLLRDFGALNMRTIDSLLHLIVRLAALDLNLPPDFKPAFAEDEIFAPLLDDMAEQARTEPSHADGGNLSDAFREACHQVLLFSDFQGFLAGDNVRDRIARLAARLLHHPDEAIELADPHDIDQRLAELCTTLRTQAQKLQNGIKNNNLAANKNFLAALTSCVERADSRLPPDSKMLHKSCLNECLNKVSQKKGGEQLEALYLRLTETTRILDTDGAVLRAAQRYMPFVELARRVLDALPEFQRRTGKIPASLVPVLAERALGGAYGVNEAFCRMGSRLTHILVDEFQDTSVEQWLALKPLIVEALSHRGSLTIVGDVKQAVYGWRGGEAALFELALEDSELRRLAPDPTSDSLDRNWRSRENIIFWNNAVFSQLGDFDKAEAVITRLLTGPRDKTGTAFSDITATTVTLLSAAFTDAEQASDPAKPGGLVRLRLLPPPPPRGRKSRSQDESEDEGQDQDTALANLLTTRVTELKLRYGWGDICILTRTNTQTSRAAAWLLAAGIPVVTQGSLLLAEQPLIAQTVALLVFLNAPEDDNAFWTVLTGEELLPPLTGLDAAQIHDWATQRAGLKHRGGTLARAFRTSFPDLWRDWFAPLHDTAGLLTPYDTACEIFDHWRVHDRHPEASGFLLRFLEVLHVAEQDGLSDLAGFLDYWEKRGGEEKAPLPETMNAVSVMTIHKAKGLQFEAVIIPWHDFPLKVGKDPTPYTDKSGLSVLAPLSSAMGETYQQALADNAREILHLLYVAWTRAVSELHCFLPAPDSGPMASALDELLAPLLAELPQNDEGEWIMGVAPEPTLPEPTLPEPTLPEPIAESEQKRRPGDRADIRARAELATDAACSLNMDSPEQEAWRPMQWLPRLKIFRSPLEDWTFTARRRGTLVHHCLELLRITGSPKSDAAVAARHGLDTFPLPVPNRGETERELTDTLAWYAGLPDAAHWLAFGTPEHTLLDKNGGAHRVDLLVDDGEEMVAVEYKTGTTAPAHRVQLGGYLTLLKQADDRPCRGVLVYLDRRELIPLNADAIAGEVS